LTISDAPDAYPALTMSARMRVDVVVARVDVRRRNCGGIVGEHRRQRRLVRTSANSLVSMRSHCVEHETHHRVVDTRWISAKAFGRSKIITPNWQTTTFERFVVERQGLGIGLLPVDRARAAPSDRA
jgi:hypothetical protein